MPNKEEVIAIGKVEIIIKGEKHALTLVEAKKLKDALDGLFAKEIEYVPTVPWGAHKWNYPWYSTAGYLQNGITIAELSTSDSSLPKSGATNNGYTITVS